MNKELQTDKLPQREIDSCVRQVKNMIAHGTQLIHLQGLIIGLETENGRIPDAVQKELNKCIS